MRRNRTIRWGVVLVLAASVAAAQAPPQAPPAQGAPAAGTSGAIQARVAPPARILNFTAQPASIQPGQSATLVWSTENPSGTTLDPGIGRVTSRGTRQVSPSATTTYTLTVRGPNNTTVTRSVTVNVAGTAPIGTTAAAEPARKEVPRTADGKPDLSGVYDFNLRAPAAPAGAAAAGGAAPAGGRGGRGGRGGNAAAAGGPVLKAGAEKYRVVRGPNDSGLTSDCMPLAGPQAFGVPYQFQIVQSAHHVAILHEYPGTFRIVPTDGGPHQADPDPTWMGDSVGHWEGDTLVVDTIAFNDKTEISGYRHSEALHMVERFRRSDYDTLQYEATLEDPNVFEKPWTVTRGFSLRPDLAKIDEFVCENNRDYSKFFGTK